MAAPDEADELVRWLHVPPACLQTPCIRGGSKLEDLRDNASTVKVDVQFPNGIFVASPMVMPGWKGRVITKKLPKPVEIEPGFSVSSRVDRVVFSGGRIGPGQFLSFPVSIKAPAVKAGTLLTFKALQTYSNGEVVRWIGNPSADEPAPQVLIRPLLAGTRLPGWR